MSDEQFTHGQLKFAMRLMLAIGCACGALIGRDGLWLAALVFVFAVAIGVRDALTAGVRP